MVQSSATSPRLLRQINSGLVVKFALQADAFSATEAMAATGLTRATVLDVCNELIPLGWLEEIEDSRVAGLSHRGRPARRYRLRADAGAVVGVDAGVHTVDALVADLRGNTLALVRRRVTDQHFDVDHRIGVVTEIVATALREADRVGAVPLLTVIGVPAPVIDEDGHSPKDTNWAFWRSMNPGFQDHLGGAVVIENDANLAVIAEQAAWGGQNIAALLAGERFGSGIILDGRLIRGRGAGEMRFLELLTLSDPDLQPISGLGVIIRYTAVRDLTLTDEPSSLRDLEIAALNVKDVVAASIAGDALATRAVREAGERLAQVAIIFESLLGVGRIVVGGAIAESLEPILEHARHAMDASLLAPFPTIVASTLGPDAIVRGAVDLALKRIRESPFDFLLVDAAETVPSAMEASTAQ